MFDKSQSLKKKSLTHKLNNMRSTKISLTIVSYRVQPIYIDSIKKNYTIRSNLPIIAGNLPNSQYYKSLFYEGLHIDIFWLTM